MNTGIILFIARAFISLKLGDGCLELLVGLKLGWASIRAWAINRIITVYLNRVLMNA